MPKSKPPCSTENPRKHPVARYRGYMVEVTMNNGRHVFLGRHERAPFNWSWTAGHRNRTRDRCGIVAGWASPGVWYFRPSAELAIRNARAADKMRRSRDDLRSFRIIPVVIEVRLKLHVPVGYVEEPTIAKHYRRLQREPAQRKRIRRRDIL